MEAQAHAVNVNAPMPLLNAVKELSFQFSMNRYGCRVVHRLINLLPPEGTRDLLDINIASKEFKMATDQNGNHIVQRIIADHTPDIYADFMKAMINSAGLCAIIEDKYGSRVLQCVFERIVAICEDKNQHPKSRKYVPYFPTFFSYYKHINAMTGGPLDGGIRLSTGLAGVRAIIKLALKKLNYIRLNKSTWYTTECI